MSDRLRHINRILKLQRQLHQLSECTLVSFDWENKQLMDSQERVFVSLSGGELALHDRFIRNASRRLKTIASEQSKLMETRQRVEAGLQRQERMMEVTKRQLGRVEKDERAVEEKRQLALVIDSSLTQREASLAQGPAASVKRK
ncbi:flagellar biosynthesis protein R [Breoghania sp.]|uniref:flagellar biosynthesis protein R n=1 Tax=Breoghania sp. TaxID=2065378 RepID=UPI00261CE8D0|nr:flagellar biosynthesis protein R [Breoghania sp.]MDJ0929498.1 flagellar biosynthesis protein R [Breoghania sp.]